MNGMRKRTKLMLISMVSHSLKPKRHFLIQNALWAEDVEHSQKEKRYFCFGKVGDGVMTVRFTYRSTTIRIIGAGYWRAGKKIYEKEQD